MERKIHPIYRNLTRRDTLFGLDMTDLVIMACVINIVFRLHRTDETIGKILNVVIVAIVYLGLVFIKSQFPKSFLKNMAQFLFKRRRMVPDRDTYRSISEVRDAKARD